MIMRTGPYDKPPPQPKDFARKHPIRHALGTLLALAMGAVILLAALAFLVMLLAAF